MIRCDLISVSDKTGIVEVGRALKHFQVEVVTTGDTATALQEANIPITSVSDYTGFPEMMEGRLKTLHPRIYGSLLGRRDNPLHVGEARTYGIKWIDLVVVNLYPFEKIARETKKPALKELIENIDIGGVTMIRAAAKNFEFCTVIVDPKDYPTIIQRMKDNPNDPFDSQFRYQMALKAFNYTSLYDSLIAETLSHYDLEPNLELKRRKFPTYHSFHGKLVQELRYGENPQQSAAYYRMQLPNEKSPLSQSLQGKELSFNNLLDGDACWRILSELPKRSTVIIKHNNPCGVGLGKTETESFDRALEADSESAFGGIVGISGTVDQSLAQKLSQHFFEIICAENFTMEAREILQAKKNLRLLLIPNEATLNYEPAIDCKKVTGGYLIQEHDNLPPFNDGILGLDAQVVTSLRPSDRELEGLKLAWVIAKNAKSNAVIIASENQSLGIGCGQVNRKLSSKVAAESANRFNSKIKVCASDGFFPFADSLPLLKEAGVTAIVQPGGSIKDKEVIEACNELKLSMIVTGTRHFLH